MLVSHLVLKEQIERLTLGDGDVARRVSHKAQPQLVSRLVREWEEVVEREKACSAEEREKLDAMVHDCRFHDTVALRHFDARSREYAPATGYVSVMHHDTTFVFSMLDRHLFRGLAMVTLRRKARFTDHEMQLAQTRCNQMIRDQQPPSSVSSSSTRGAVDVWLREAERDVSLGPFAQLGVYQSVSTADGGSMEQSYHAIVVCSMGDETYEKLVEMAKRDWDHRLSVKEVLTTFLFPLRERLLVRRQNLLTLYLQSLQEITENGWKPRTNASHDVVDRPPVDASSSVLPPTATRYWIDVPLPPGTRFPARIPRGCPPFPSSFSPPPLDRTASSFTHRSLDDLGVFLPAPLDPVTPTQNVFLDDWCVNPLDAEHMLRYASCSDCRTGTLFFLGLPQSHITLWKRVAKKTVGFSTEETAFWATRYWAHPSQARVLVSSAATTASPAIGGIPSMLYTWEDPECTSNILMTSDTLSEKMSMGPDLTIHWSQVLFLPQFVRMSCRDALGRVAIPSRAPRMSGFASSTWKGL